MNAGVFYKVANQGNTINLVNFTLEEIEDFAFAVAEEPTVDDNSVIVTKAV